MGTGRRFRKLISKGPKVQCSFSGLEYYYNQTVSDERGQRKAKDWDIFVNFPELQKSKYRKGRKWQRGY